MAEMLRVAFEPEKLARLARALQDELGHDLSFAVEQGKIAANAGDAASILLDPLEAGLAVPHSPEALAESLARHAEALARCARETLRLADLNAAQVETVIHAGGSRLMAMVSRAMQGLFKQAQHETSEVFSAVADR